MSTMPMVAIAMQSADEPGRYSISQRYLSLFSRHGANMVAVSPETGEEELACILDRCDGLVVPGGNDINPELYGEKNTGCLGTFVPARDEFESRAIRFALAHDLPVLGICRGMQMLNVVCGGTLIQDISSSVPHASFEKIEKRVHTAKVVANSQVLTINSAHHQAIDRMGEGLRCAVVADDGIVEAVYDPAHRFCAGVQWHPECIPDEEGSCAVSGDFVAACRAYRQDRGAVHVG